MRLHELVSLVLMFVIFYKYNLPRSISNILDENCTCKRITGVYEIIIIARSCFKSFIIVSVVSDWLRLFRCVLSFDLDLSDANRIILLTQFAQVIFETFEIQEWLKNLFFRADKLSVRQLSR